MGTSYFDKTREVYRSYRTGKIVCSECRKGYGSEADGLCSYCRRHLNPNSKKKAGYAHRS